MEQRRGVDPGWRNTARMWGRGVWGPAQRSGGAVGRQRPEAGGHARAARHGHAAWPVRIGDGEEG
jgi:hypothetical protein